MEKAKPYTKIGPAKGQITRWSGLYPDFPVPLLVICDVTIKERKDLTKDVGVKRGKALQALVNEANRYSQQMKESPEPTSYKDRPAIEYRSSLARYHNTAIYLIKTRFKGIDLSTIGLTDIKLSS